VAMTPPYRIALRACRKGSASPATLAGILFFIAKSPLLRCFVIRLEIFIACRLTSHYPITRYRARACEWSHSLTHGKHHAPRGSVAVATRVLHSAEDRVQHADLKTKDVAVIAVIHFAQTVQRFDADTEALIDLVDEIGARVVGEVVGILGFAWRCLFSRLA
ncbi:MAG: hypothetical protein ACREBU_24705, partial [Nitrososphaera sp.]